MNTNSKIQDKKLELIQWVSMLQDAEIIEKILEIRRNESKDWWVAVSEVEKKSIEKGLLDANDEKLIPQSKVRKLYEKWL